MTETYEVTLIIEGTRMGIESWLDRLMECNPMIRDGTVHRMDDLYDAFGGEE